MTRWFLICKKIITVKERKRKDNTRLDCRWVHKMNISNASKCKTGKYYASYDRIISFFIRMTSVKMGEKKSTVH